MQENLELNEQQIHVSFSACRMQNRTVKFLPVWPLFVTYDWYGLSMPINFSGGRLTFLTLCSSMLMGDWCFPMHVWYSSPQCSGPTKIRSHFETRIAELWIMNFSVRLTLTAIVTEVLTAAKTWRRNVYCTYNSHIM